MACRNPSSLNGGVASDAFAHGLRAAVRFNAQAFGFSIVVTSTFGIVAAFEGTPTVGETYAFMSGAVLGFVTVLALATAGFTRTAMEAERAEILAVATALALGATASGLGAATLVVHFLGGLLAWGLAPFVATRRSCSCSGSSSPSSRKSRTSRLPAAAR